MKSFNITTSTVLKFFRKLQNCFFVFLIISIAKLFDDFPFQQFAREGHERGCRRDARMRAREAVAWRRKRKVCFDIDALRLCPVVLLIFLMMVYLS